MSGFFTPEPQVRTPIRFTGEAAISYLLGAFPAGSNQPQEAIRIFNRVHHDFPAHDAQLLRREFLCAVEVLVREGVFSFRGGNDIDLMVLWRR